MSIKRQPYCAIIILKGEKGDRQNVVYGLLYIKEKLKSKISHSQEAQNADEMGMMEKEEKKKLFFITFCDI